VTVRALLACLALLPCLADAGPTGHGDPVRIEATAVEVPGDLHRSVRALGAWVLEADHAAFGGFSGLLVEDGRLTAVSDRGHWLTARIAREGGALRLDDARIAPILTHRGAPLSGAGVDAEGLARRDGDLLVAFERDHRIMRHIGEGRVGAATRAPAFETLGGNAGLEGLATLPGGDILAIAEGPEDGAFPMWRLTGAGTLARAALPQRSRHRVTGAETGPDGRLHVVQRHYSPLTGVSIRLLAYRLDAAGWPDPGLVTELAAFESASGIDNMEALALARAPDGTVVIWVLSDDNFNAPQRTLLVALALAP